LGWIGAEHGTDGDGQVPVAGAESEEPTGAKRLVGFVFFEDCRTQGGLVVANHLTPDELAKEFGIDRRDVIRVCIAESVPIYNGRIDKTLFAAAREEHVAETVTAG
jgi:hypothetical protein